jgi:hypothetical protein
MWKFKPWGAPNLSRKCATGLFRFVNEKPRYLSQLKYHLASVPLHDTYFLKGEFATSRTFPTFIPVTGNRMPQLY